jgi:PAS domain S-box-containing protein
MDVNKATIEVTGVSHEQLIGSDFSDYFTEPDKARSIYQLVLSKGQVIDYALAIRQVSGNIVEVLYDACVYENQQGTIEGVFAAARDLTKLKQAEEALSIQTRIATIFAMISHDEVFNELLKLVLSVLQSPFGFFGYLNEAGDLVIPTMTRQVWDKCQVTDKEIIFYRDTWGDSSWPTAIRQKKSFIPIALQIIFLSDMLLFKNISVCLFYFKVK